MRAPIDTVQRFWQQVENFGGTAPAPNATAPAAATTFLTKLFTGTRNFASGFLTTLLFLFFLLQPGAFRRRIDGASELYCQSAT